MKWITHKTWPWFSSLDRGCVLRARVISVSMTSKRHTWEIRVTRGSLLTLSTTLAAATAAEARTEAVRLQRILVLGIEASDALDKRVQPR